MACSGAVSWAAVGEAKEAAKVDTCDAERTELDAARASDRDAKHAYNVERVKSKGGIRHGQSEEDE